MKAAGRREVEEGKGKGMWQNLFANLFEP